MSEVIDCPSCHRKLKLPVELRRQQVRCPTCATTFTPAFADEPPTPPAARPTVEPSLDSEPDSEPRRNRRQDRAPELTHCPHCGAIIHRTATQCRRCQAFLDKDVEEVCHREAHRGGIILTFGILSALFGTLSVCCGIPALLGLAFGIPAWVMASHDLHKMRIGGMDRDGMANTQSGQSYAIVGVVLSSLCGIGYGLMFVARPSMWMP